MDSTPVLGSETMCVGDDFCRCCELSSSMRFFFFFQETAVQESSSGPHNTSDVDIIHSCSLLLLQYPYHTIQTYSQPHLSAITHVSLFTCNAWNAPHKEPRLCPTGADLSLTDGLTFADSQPRTALPRNTHRHAHREIRAVRLVFHSKKISLACRLISALLMELQA